MLWNLFFALVLPVAFLIGLGDILVVQARNRGRNAALWSLVGCAATLAAGVAGFFAAPFVVDLLKPDPQKEGRVFMLSIGVPAVAAAAVVGGLLRVLPQVAKRSSSYGGAAITMKAEEWHIRDQCRACGFYFDVGDMMCQCPVCAGFYHVRCWNETAGCSACARPA